MEYAKRILPSRLTAPRVLSPEDESFLTTQLAAAPDVILPGPSRTPSTPGTPTAEIPALALTIPIPPTPANEPAELDPAAEPDTPAHPPGWRSSLTARVSGLRRRVSRRSTPAEPDTGARTASPSPPPLPPRPAPNPEARDEELQTLLRTLSLPATEPPSTTTTTTTPPPSALRTLLPRFTQILKDLLTGVPTALNDLTTFLADSSAQLQAAYDDLPGFVQRLVKRAGSTAGLREVAGRPEALAGVLRGVLKVLQGRWPGLVGAGGAGGAGSGAGAGAMAGLGGLGLGLAVGVVMLGIWYCWKRGREVRLEREGGVEMGVVGEGVQGNVLEGGVREDPLLVRGRKVG